MWHNTRLLNAFANTLYAVAAFMLLCIAILSVLNSPLFPLHTISVQSETTLHHVNAEMIGDALVGRVRGNFFAVDLPAVRASLEALPWVRRAELRREWPDRLLVRLEEQVPFARWSDTQLVNTHGELFEAQSAEALPRFNGPPGSERELSMRYQNFAELLAPLSARIAQITLSPRRAWQLQLALPEQAPLTLMLGRADEERIVDKRLTRFVNAYPQMMLRLNRRIEYVDLRYPNGFAVRVPGIEALDRKKSA